MQLKVTVNAQTVATPDLMLSDDKKNSPKQALAIIVIGYYNSHRGTVGGHAEISLKLHNGCYIAVTLNTEVPCTPHEQTEQFP